MNGINRVAAGLLCFGYALGVISTANAVPITFFHEGSGSGTLAEVPFLNADFVITAIGNTNSRASVGADVYYIDHDTAEISIEGVGNLTFVSPTRTFVNQSHRIVGFSRAGSSGADLFNGPTNNIFSSWEMLTSIGPIQGNGNLLQWEDNIQTSGGILFFEDQPVADATFTADVVPEPSPVLLVLSGSIALFRRYH